jgi:hypothetical protein
MKKCVYIFVLNIICATSLFGQMSMKDLYVGKEKLTFLGYDFTQARFIGSTSFTDAKSIRDYFMNEWNKLIFLEPKKYSLQEPMKLPPGKYRADTDCLTALNKTIDMKGKVIDEPYQLSLEDATHSVENYKCELKEGVGCSFVIESFSKPDEKVTVWVMFFDLSTMKILLSEKIAGNVGGSGVRNYYAGGLCKITEKIDNDYYKKWRAAAK